MLPHQRLRADTLGGIVRVPLFTFFLLVWHLASGSHLCAAMTRTPALISGDGHYLVLGTDGTLYTWGRNDFGQLGLGGRPAAAWGGPTTPTAVPSPGGQRQWVKIGAGDNHSLAIASDGSLWVWGRNDLEQLGFHASWARKWTSGGNRETRPVQVNSDRDWLAVTGGMLSSYALKQDGSLWVWGGNWVGQLGDGQPRPLLDFNPPLDKVPRLSAPSRLGHDSDWKAVAAGGQHVLAQKRNGTLWAWGRNDCGELGIGTFLSTNLPIPVGSDQDWTALSAGGAGMAGGYSAAIKRDGTLWVWGNWKRQRVFTGAGGTNRQDCARVPVRLGAEADWAEVVCGNQFGAALKTNGTLWVWGALGSARLPGITVPAQVDAPIQIGTEHDWLSVSVDGKGLGNESTLHGLKTDGTVWSWDPMVQAQGNAGTGTPRKVLAIKTALPR